MKRKVWTERRCAEVTARETEQDVILQQLINWKELTSYPPLINAMIKGNIGLQAYHSKYNSIDLVALDKDVKCIVLREEQNLRERICLPLSLILLAFEKAHHYTSIAGKASRDFTREADA